MSEADKAWLADLLWVIAMTIVAACGGDNTYIRRQRVQWADEQEERKRSALNESSRPRT